MPKIPEKIPRGWNVSEKAFAQAKRLLEAGVIPQTYSTEYRSRKNLNCLKRAAELLSQIDRRQGNIIDIGLLCENIIQVYSKPGFDGYGIEHNLRIQQAVEFVRMQLENILSVNKSNYADVATLLFLAESKLLAKRQARQFLVSQSMAAAKRRRERALEEFDEQKRKRTGKGGQKRLF